jgi:hypothetical protein
MILVRADAADDGRCVDDEIRLFVIEEATDGGDVEEIELTARRGEHVIRSEARQLCAQREAEKAISAG